LWKQIAGLPDDHIHYFGKDNFWEMGETGPCGPCTEIHIDRTPNGDGGQYVNGDNPDVMEIWNLVFIQYNRDAAGKLTTLPAQHVDTGMGLERICQVIQGKSDNFATDLWTPLFEKITELSGIRYAGKFPRTNAADALAESMDTELRQDIAFRVVADHARCLTFALTDGAVPSNEGRGYVLRRILRRAIFWGWQHLGLTDLFIYKFVPVIVDAMGQAFPELKNNPKRVSDLIKDEEISFSRTRERGLQLFEEAVQDSKLQFGLQQEINPGGSAREIEATESQRRYAKKYPREKYPTPVISDEAAFILHDTYGMTIDLTRLMAEQRNIGVDVEGYERLMEEARERSRAVSATGETVTLADFLQQNALPHTIFAGYESTQIRERMPIWLFRKSEGAGTSPAHEIRSGDVGVLVVASTPFYAESGGQVGDAGTVVLNGSTTLKVDNTVKVGGVFFHHFALQEGPNILVAQSSDVNLTVDKTRRQKIMANHTSTHVANWALREVLGDDVQQKGSLVDPDKLRFDFSHGKSMTDDELTRVESLVNEQIHKKLPVYAEVAPQEEALKINGLRAVFGEKYPPMVRVVSVGVPVKDLLANPTNPEWRKYSVEFCGGTHLANTADAEAFCIAAEESVSKGIRRIVALTGENAKKARQSESELDNLIGQAASSADEQLADYLAQIHKALAAGTIPLLARRRAQTAINELQTRHKQWEKKQQSSAGSGVDAIAAAGELLSQATPLGPGKLIVGEIAGAGDEQLRLAMDWLRKKSTSYAIMLAAGDAQKVNFVAAVSDDLIALGLKAGDWVREAAKTAGGGGGGRPQMAQAGGKDPAKLPQALEAAGVFARNLIQ
jgi:alanyl-tRNA synthetase